MKTVKLLTDVGAKNKGERKRLPNTLANKLVKAGKAAYIKDVVEELNKVKPPKTMKQKPQPEENKAMNVKVETKQKSKPRRTRKSTKK